MIRSKTSVCVATVILLGTFGAANAVATDSEPRCQRVQGYLEETLVTTGCTSVVGLCTVARMFGTLKGEARFAASAFIPSADTPTTGVVFVTGDTLLINAQLGDKRGRLNIKNAAAYQTVGDGNLVDNQAIVGGTGDFIGATGTLRISGTFLAATGGSASFEGTVCVP